MDELQLCVKVVTVYYLSSRCVTVLEQIGIWINAFKSHTKKMGKNTTSTFVGTSKSIFKLHHSMVCASSTSVQ